MPFETSRSVDLRVIIAVVLILSAGITYAEQPVPQAPASPQPVERIRPPPKPLSLDDIEDADLKEAWSREAKTKWTQPPMGVGAQSGFGAGWGTFFTGVNFVSRTRDSAVADGLLVAGFGIGNSRKNVGFETALIIANLDPFAQDMAVNLKLHRMLTDDFAVSVGMENIIFRGSSDGTYTGYAAASKFFYLKNDEFAPFSTIALHGGVGGGRFRSEADVQGGRQTLGIFGSVGIRVWAPVSVAVGWTGRDIDLAIPLAPFRSFRLTIVPTLTEAAGISGRPKALSLTIVYGESFLSDTFPFASARNFR